MQVETYSYCDFSQDVLGDGLSFFNNFLVELIQRSVHQLHADPNITLTKTHVAKVRYGDRTETNRVYNVGILLYLSEEGAVEGHSVEAVYSPHRNVQVHQKSLLLQGVDSGTNPLGGANIKTGNIKMCQRLNTNTIPFPL